MKSTLVLLSLALAASCSSPAEDPAPYLPPLEPTEEIKAQLEPWTEAFLAEKVLIADRIRLRGPLQLIDHIAVVQDPERVEMSVEGVGNELQNRYRTRAGVLEPQVRAQLDGWSLVAAQELVVIQDLAADQVVLEAQGGVALIDVVTSEAARSEDFALAEPLVLPAVLQSATVPPSETVAGQAASSGIED